MIICRMRYGDEDMVLFGLSAENVENLRKDKPILTDLEKIGMPSQQVALTYLRKDGFYAIPQGPAELTVIAIDDETLRLAWSFPMHGGDMNFKYVLMIGDTETSLRRQLTKSLGPPAQVIDERPVHLREPSDN